MSIITGMHARSPINPPRGGLLLCLAAAAGFSTTGIFAKLAYASHVSVTTLLSVRFLLAAVILWLVVAATRQPLPSRRTAVAGFVLGLAGYGLQVTLLFLSLERIDASLSALLFYSYPALVTTGAVLIGRERLTRHRGGALAVALAGVVLVFSGAVVAQVDGVGVLLSVAAAAVYAVLILIVDTLGRGVRPLVLATWVTTGDAVAFALGGLLLGDLRFALAPAGWGAIVGLAVVATVVPLTAFYAGIAHVGPSTASIMLTVEPAVTVLLAAVLLRETLGVRQFLGGALILTAVLLLQVRWGKDMPLNRSP
jgi:drug/metabolite transporter (DMT)-like permease